MNDPFKHRYVGLVRKIRRLTMLCEAWNDFGSKWYCVECKLSYTNAHKVWIETKLYKQAMVDRGKE